VISLTPAAVEAVQSTLPKGFPLQTAATILRFVQSASQRMKMELSDLNRVA